MFERIDIIEQMCEYGLHLLEHLFEGVVMRSKSIVQVQAKTVNERYRNSFLRAHHRILAVVVAMLACFALCCVTAGARENTVPSEAASSEVVHYTVQPGDSLWSIASRFPGDSSSAYQRVERLKQVNNLPGGSIQAGQHLVIPL
ncbi:peptidoglycan-binding protein [Bifidobacterium animalis subsp. animalis MCC 1489]|uniref:Peptidoglycan-binding protein n=2 Tax=Bifidobacterium animalis subsp. animalis TaxID=302912 RepID=A0AB34T8E0_9BIFI|nr:LysM peptidoglycan-binding domain-containing protein [Bifidobacterium animalis]AFI63391.1 hypothetical protein BANAN_05915 [Bifidobacterium animalis subsp. animalis ATCC 25527]KOA55274.1 peptidoglycan-binding protein [Bifidobacterium animalis subsp. animalis ATCC 27672]KOA62239.1 peptidoglycan-binding protein [Bifidobacterium animalis subsp. animalis MCC 0499]KOA63085.1 peptidoglycan-binding protein [Bifidobacterium animalis subsp. animalis MCC 1489]CDI66772.1 Uncharacterized protein BANIM3